MGTVKQSVYLQIVSGIQRKIELGLLCADEKLPSCREYAIKMGINPNTVQRAYSVLEEQGYIYTVPKKGVYVSSLSGADKSEHIAREKLNELKDAGIPRKKLIGIINEIYGEYDD